MKIEKTNSKEYTWGQKCKGWHLVNTNQLSVIQELMPTGTEEVKHKHNKSQQFFYILKGQAIFIIDGKRFEVGENQGVYVNPNSVHQIKNETNSNLEFLVISQPHAHGDRIVAND